MPGWGTTPAAKRPPWRSERHRHVERVEHVVVGVAAVPRPTVEYCAFIAA
jgi:hypothetical protein